MHDLFNGLIGIGCVLCIGTGFICAVRAGGSEGPVLYDAYGIAGHWRGWVKIGLAMMGVGTIGLIVVNVAT